MEKDLGRIRLRLDVSDLVVCVAPFGSRRLRPPCVELVQECDGLLRSLYNTLHTSRFAALL